MPLSREFVWATSRLGSGKYELRDDTLVATLYFEPITGIVWAFRNPHEAVVTAGDRRWKLTVEREGFAGALGLRAQVHIAGSATGHLAARAFLSAGELKFDDGKAFRWAGGLTRGSTSRFLSDGEQPIVALAAGSVFDRINSRVTLFANPADDRYAVLLASLGMYVRILMSRHWR